jgi:hypothetical protein
MTDYTDLIAWLRTSHKIYDHEAADALEAQARRIKELEAALKPMTAVVEFLLPFGDLSDEERAQWGEIMRAARAALGEKDD